MKEETHVSGALDSIDVPPIPALLMRTSMPPGKAAETVAAAA